MTENDRKRIASDLVYMREAAFYGQKESNYSDIQVSQDLIVGEIINEYGNSPYFAACLAFIAGVSVGKRLERSRQLKAHARGFNMALEYVRRKQKETLKGMNKDDVWLIKQLHQ